MTAFSIAQELQRLARDGKYRSAEAYRLLTALSEAEDLVAAVPDGWQFNASGEPIFPLHMGPFKEAYATFNDLCPEAEAMSSKAKVENALIWALRSYTVALAAIPKGAHEMSDREVEAVARAIYEATPSDYVSPLPFDKLVEEDAEVCRRQARAAIAAYKATLPAEPARVSGVIEALKAKWQGGTLYDVGTIRSAIDQAAAIVASERDALVGALAQNMRNLAETERGFGKYEAAWAYWRCANLLTQALAASRPPETARVDG